MPFWNKSFSVIHSDLHELCNRRDCLWYFFQGSRLWRSFTVLEDSFNVNHTNKSASELSVICCNQTLLPTFLCLYRFEKWAECTDWLPSSPYAADINLNSGITHSRTVSIDWPCGEPFINISDKGKVELHANTNISHETLFKG